MKKKLKANKKFGDFRDIKAHVFRGKKYKVIWRKPPDDFFDYDADGSCDDRNATQKEMWINPDVDQKEFLKICIDESFHACLFEVDNEIVDEISESMGEFLWRIGFRLEHEQDK